jgi:hypothetical protein
MFIGPFNIMKEKEEELKAKFFEISFSVHSKFEGEIHFSGGGARVVTPQNYKFWNVTKIHSILKHFLHRLKFVFRI